MSPRLSELGEAVLAALPPGWQAVYGTADGFGLVRAAIVDFSAGDPGPRVWAESDFTWRVEFAIPGSGLTVAAEWWLRPRGSDAALTELLVAICRGDYALDTRDDLQVRVASKRMPITLPTFPVAP